MSSGRVLARNSALNILGHVAPLAVAIAAIPPLIRGLGQERFGVLTLVWAGIGYFGVFEFGLGRALTQRVAQHLSSGRQDELPGTARSALLMLAASGAVGGALLASGSWLLVTRVLNIPESLHAESIAAFWILSATLPFVLTTIGLRGLMEAHQHFGLATALRIPSALVSYVGPLCTLPFSTSLVPATIAVAVGRVAAFGVHLWVCLRAYPYLRHRAAIRGEPVMSLVRFGAWMTVSNVVSPIMSYLDRFFIGAMLTVSAVTAYATPQEAVVKLLVIPSALTGAVFPALSSAIDPARLTALYERSMRAVLLAMFPLTLVAVALAPEALRYWVGPLLPSESARVLQWLAIGVFATALGHVPATALHSARRPDIVARLHLVELPLYLIVLIVLLRARGLEGAAIAWTARAALDAAALLWIAHRRLELPVVPRQGGAAGVLAMVVLLAAGALLPGTTARLAFLAVVGAIAAPVAWFKLLMPVERDGLRSWIASAAAAGDRRQ